MLFLNLHYQSLTPRRNSCLVLIASLIKVTSSFFSNSTFVSTRSLQYLFTDVWSSPITSIDNYKYYLILVDHFTCYTWLYPLKQKSQIRDIFTAYKALVENHFNTRINTLYSDNGGEFVVLRSYLSEHRISQLTTLLQHTRTQWHFKKKTPSCRWDKNDTTVLIYMNKVCCCQYISLSIHTN